ncbi:uncharacterized protein METZ01_LOCUS24714 [marine metagenome]|uniref:Uncharacterized protein n=1 Tax=marine metagenome TaxID=408172 RepID=A0A381PYC1_9ZZZZ
MRYEPANDSDSRPRLTRLGSMECTSSARISNATVGRISRRAVLCIGSGSMYQPFLVLIRKGNGLRETSHNISGISESSDLQPLHSIIQSSSVPILKDGGGCPSDSTTTSIIGTARGSM